MSGKTPAHLFCYVGPSWGGRGKSFYPRPSVPRLRRKSIVAPPLLAKPVPRGAGVLHEINFYQNSTHHLIPKAPLQRLIREIAATESEVSCSPGLSYIISDHTYFFMPEGHSFYSTVPSCPPRGSRSISRQDTSREYDPCGSCGTYYIALH